MGDQGSLSKTVSVITVCFNSVSTIRDTIESVLSQNYVNIEYIIIDGLSNDGTINIIREYTNEIDVIVSEPDNGIYDAMNKGIENASGDIVGILNSDDVFEDEAVLSHIARAFEGRPNVDMVFGDVVFSRQEELTKIARYYSSVHFSRWKLRFGWMPPHPATFVKRSVYRSYGLYSSEYKIAADYEMFVRWLLVHRLKYFRIDKTLVRMRTGGVSTSGLKSNFILNREIVKACKSNGIYTNLMLVLSKVPFKLLELFRRPAGSK